MASFPPIRLVVITEELLEQMLARAWDHGLSIPEGGSTRDHEGLRAEDVGRILAELAAASRSTPRLDDAGRVEFVPHEAPPAGPWRAVRCKRGDGSDVSDYEGRARFNVVKGSAPPFKHLPPGSFFETEALEHVERLNRAEFLPHEGSPEIPE